VFIGSCNGLFRRLDAKAGKVQWETKVGGEASKYFFHGDVFVVDDRIIASADVEKAAGVDAGIHAFDRESGRQLWTYRAGRGVLGAVVGTGRRVFAYTATGDLIALDIDSGKLAWSHPLKASAWESPGVAVNRVFGGSDDGSLYAFSAETGRIEWQRKLSAAIATSIRANDSSLYVGTSDGAMHRLSPATGEPLSSQKLDSALKPSSAPLITKDAVIVLLADERADYRAIVALDPALGSVKWRREAPTRWTTSRVFATDNTTIVGGPTGELTAYCVADGSSAWSHKVPMAPIRSIGGTTEMLYVGTPQGALFAIRPPRACS
jgi:eukaryotic-like serine/threonine-protein kinase